MPRSATLQHDEGAVGLQQVRAQLTGQAGVVQLGLREPALVGLHRVGSLIHHGVAHPVEGLVEDAAVLGDASLQGRLEQVGTGRLGATVLGLEVGLRGLQRRTEPNLGLAPTGLLPSRKYDLVASGVHEQDDGAVTLLLDQRLGPPLDLAATTEDGHEEAGQPPEGAILPAVDALDQVDAPGAQPPPEQGTTLNDEGTCGAMLRQPLSPIHVHSIQSRCVADLRS